MLIQLILQGIATGFVYALVALGYTLVFRTLNHFIFCLGHVYMTGSIFGFMIAVSLGLNAWLTLLITTLAGFIIGFILDRFILRKLYDVPTMTFVIATMGLGIVLQNLVRIRFPNPVKYPDIFGTRVFKIFGASIAEQYFWVIGIAIILFIIVYVLLSFTRVGQAMRAVAADRPIAAAMGINVRVYISFTIILSIVVAVIGGVLIGPLYFASFEMGNMMGLKAFSASVLGGVTSVPGAMVGGIILGILENLGAGYISSAYKDVFSLGILVLMLLFRPYGILGKARPTKV
ncbi:MAG: branched-chain amino acid ABC transporter permease [Caulobacteraceae bacterium]